jgi:hypothetical protein
MTVFVSMVLSTPKSEDAMMIASGDFSAEINSPEKSVAR